MRIEENTKLVMIGDSITDCGRKRPVAEGADIGDGYVKLVAGLIGAVYPEKNIRIVNMGIGGNTVRALKERWQTDVLDLAPDWVSIMIGANDVRRQFDRPHQTELHVYLDEYENTLDELIQLTLPQVKGLVLMTPFFVELRTEDAVRAAMDRYGAVVKKLAVKYNTVFVDTQSAINTFLEYHHSPFISWDRTHPNHIGHMVIARAFLKAIGFGWM